MASLFSVFECRGRNGREGDFLWCCGHRPHQEMLACIACAKDGGEDTARAGTQSTKSLTSQIKDMVLKFSGLQCKGGASSSSASHRYKGRYQHQHHRHRGAFADIDEDGGASDGGSHYGYLRAGSSRSTSAWDFASNRTEGVGKAKWSTAGPGNGVVAPADVEVVIEENSGEPKEWTALVEPGVQITFVSLPGGAGNDLKRIRFSREMFNKWQAQRWWGENFDRIMELYNVQRFSRQALPTPPRSDDGGEQRESFYSRVGSTRDSPVTPPFACRDNNRMMYRNNNNNNNYSSYRAPSTSSSRTGGSGGGGGVGGGDCYFPSVPDPTEHILPHHLFHHHAVASAAAVAGGGIGIGVGVGMRVENSSMDASRTTTSSRDEAASISVSNASDMEMTEWVEQDEPGVYITIRELPDGTRELRRVRFSREKFGEVHAKLWWEDNRERIQAQYL